MGGADITCEVQRSGLREAAFLRGTVVAPFAGEGDAFDLEELPRWFPDGGGYAFAENGSYFLAGPRLEALATAEEVRIAATEVLNELTATISLLLTAFQRPSLGHIVQEADDGTRHISVYLSGGVKARAKVSAALTVAGATPSLPGPTQAQQALAVIKGRPRLYTAAMIGADQSHTWPRLYRVLEEIELELDGKVSDFGMCSGEDRERFRRTANTAEVAGADARHAAGKWEPPSHPMTLAEAAAFVGQLLRAAVSRRLGDPDLSGSEMGIQRTE